MTGDAFQKVELDGAETRAAATNLLLAARGDDPMLELWETGGPQWRSVDNGQGSRQHTFWLDVDEREADLRSRLEAVGSTHDPDDDIVKMWQEPARMPYASVGFRTVVATLRYVRS